MSPAEIALIRKHLPKGWRLQYEVMLTPPDDSEPRVIRAHQEPAFIAWAHERARIAAETEKALDAILDMPLPVLSSIHREAP